MSEKKIVKKPSGSAARRPSRASQKANASARRKPVHNKSKKPAPKQQAPKKRSRKGWKIAAVVASGVIAYSALFVGLQFLPADGNPINLDYGSVVYEVEEGEVFSPENFAPRSENNENAKYNEIDVFGRLNYTFMQQKNWYAQVQGWVDTGIGGMQDVQTYKRYANEMLISADITKSALVNVAREFCYVGDRVIWRDDSVTNKSKWDGLNTVFPDKTPNGNMTISGENGFKATRGLPATELSVYVFRDETVLSAEMSEGLSVESLASNADGTYTITYRMDPKIYEMEDGTVEGAAAYYANQMIFTGGLSGTPKFDYITVSYTFNQKWEVSRCDVAEAYTAVMGFVNAHCSSTSTTVYSYGVPGLGEQVDEIYESYYKKYAEGAATGAQKTIDALTCLANGLGRILNQPTTLELDLTLNGEALHGYAYVDLNLDLANLAAFDLKNIEARLALGNKLYLWLKDGVAYVQYGSIKGTLSVEELISMIGNTAESGTAPSAESGEQEDNDILADLAGGEFTYDETSAHLHSLINLLGLDVTLDFDFGLDKNMAVTFNGVTVGLEIAEMPVGAEIAFADDSLAPAALAEEEKENFTDLIPAVESVMQLVSAQNLSAEVYYAGGDLTVEGTVVLSLDGLQASGTFAIAYGELQKTLYVAYAEDGYVYLTLDGLKIKASAEEAANLVLALLAGEGEAPSEGDEPSEEADILQTVFGLVGNLEKLLSISNPAENELAAIVYADKLLEAFGVDFKLGEVQIGFADGKVSVHVSGVGLTVSASDTAPEIDTTGATDYTPVIAKVLPLLEAKAISLAGDLAFEAGETLVGLHILDGSAISWKDGTHVYLDANMVVGNTSHRIIISLTPDEVKVAYGTVGFEVRFGDFDRLEEAFDTLKERIQKEIIEPATKAPESADGSEEEFVALNGLLDMVRGGAALAGSADEFDWSILNELEIKNSTLKNGLLALAFEGLTLDIIDNVNENGLVSLKLTYAGDSFSLDGNFDSAIYTEQMPDAPVVNYLSTDDYIELLDYVGATVCMVAERNVAFTLSGIVTSTDTETYPDGVKYDIGASVQYHRGEEFPVRLVVDGSNLWLDSELFLNVSLSLAAKNEADQSLYLDVFILDSNDDGVLDFYVSVSQFAEGHEKKIPLRVYAPADEIMTLLSGAVSLLGVDNEVLNNYMVSKWLDLKTVDQLKGLGGSLLKTFLPDIDLDDPFGSLLGILFGGSEDAEEGTASVATFADGAPVAKNYISKLGFEENAAGGKDFVIALNSEDVYGIENLEDLTFTLTKADGKLTAVKLENVYDGTGTECTSLSGEILYDEITPTAPTESYTSFLGADKLLIALAKSATHEEVKSGDVISGEEAEHEYVLNSNFYIEGTITASFLSIIDVDIELVAVSVTIDENGDVGVNIRLSYSGKALLVVAINGNSVVDITIKNGMVYMKRVQTTKQNMFTNPSCAPITLYRAMPMENFMGDILNQLCFILNFGDTIAEQIKNAGNGETSEPTEPTPEEIVDYGSELQKVLQKYTYTKADDGSQTWHLEIDGTSFSDGILSDLKLDIKANPEGYIHNLNITKATLKIPVSDTFSLSLGASANLTWYNPGGVMPEGKTDQTDDSVADTIRNEVSGMGAMIAQLNETDEEGVTEWTKQGKTFLEAEELTVKYVYNTYAGGVAPISEQTVLVSTGEDGSYARTLYGSLDYPEIGSYDDGREYYLAWSDVYKTGDVLPADGNVYARQYKHLYSVTFRSKDDLGEGWNFNEGLGLYTRNFDMEYGAMVIFMANGAAYGETYTITDDPESHVITLPEKQAYAEDENIEGHWGVSLGQSGAVFTVLYDLHTVTYHSDISITVDGKPYTDYDKQFKIGAGTTLLAPTVSGYTFLGWYRLTESGWEEVTQDVLNTLIGEAEAQDEFLSVTVQALWLSDISVSITEARRGNEQGGTITKQSKYDYKMSATIEGGKLIGAFAEEEGVNVSLTYKFDVYGSGLAGSATVGEQTFDEYTESMTVEAQAVESGTSLAKRSTGRVQVTIAYTYGTLLNQSKNASSTTSSWDNL